MESTIVTLILVTLMLFGMLTLVQIDLSTQDQVLEATRAMEARVGEQARTSLLPVSATSDGTNIDVTVRNNGSVKLSDLSRWDVIVDYGSATGQAVRWCPYVALSTPGLNEWTARGIYLDAAQGIAEAYEPGILNPGEELVLHISVSPPVNPGATNTATVSTPNGVSTTIVFVR